jgi:DNA-binding NtrC family response regulator
VSGPGDRALGRIVIVDDDPFLIEQLTWALKGRFVVASARDATQGRALCESDSDLYLFDLRLPPSNEVREGLDLLRHVRRRDPEATVVMMSGEGERAHVLEAIALGAFDFFRSPWTRPSWSSSSSAPSSAGGSWRRIASCGGRRARRWDPSS